MCNVLNVATGCSGEVSAASERGPCSSGSSRATSSSSTVSKRTTSPLEVVADAQGFIRAQPASPMSDAPIRTPARIVPVKTPGRNLQKVQKMKICTQNTLGRVLH
ncbi:hypothetical protein BaRGS_00011167 [Batillaria attramentaria]|uniref:Uncharacterized protein n=1 Tax=Batillaria attramentaria TaxID=370345 RepID=A0ABD0LDY1_9CAEN